MFEFEKQAGFLDSLKRGLKHTWASLDAPINYLFGGGDMVYDEEKDKFVDKYFDPKSQKWFTDDKNLKSVTGWEDEDIDYGNYETAGSDSAGDFFANRLGNKDGMGVLPIGKYFTPGDKVKQYQKMMARRAHAQYYSQKDKQKKLPKPTILDNFGSGLKKNKQQQNREKHNTVHDLDI